MEIYNFEFGIFLNLILAFATIGMAVIAFFVICFFVAQMKAERKSKSKFSADLVVRFTIFLIIPAIFAVVFGNTLVKYASYDHNMKTGNANYLEGDVVLVSYEEEYYRGHLSGYTVVLEVDGKTITPSNTFSEDLVRHFKSEQKLIIQYGEIKNDGIYIYSIKIIE